MATPAKSEFDNTTEDVSSLFLEALSIPAEKSTCPKEPKSQTAEKKVMKPLGMKSQTEGTEIPKPLRKVVPLMELSFDTKSTAEEDRPSEETSGKKYYRPKKQLRNVLNRMQDAEYGPLSILYRSVQDKLKVKVWTRSYRHVRGICTGYIVAFDKHWNLAMSDVDEIYTKPFPRRTAWTMNVGNNQLQDSLKEDEGEGGIDPSDANQMYGGPFDHEGPDKDERDEPPGEDNVDISAELQTLSLLKEKLVQLEQEEEKAAANKPEEVADREERNRNPRPRDSQDKLKSGGKSQRETSDRSSHRSRRRSTSRDRSPRSSSRRHQRRESPPHSRHRSAHRHRRGESGNSRDRSPSRRHKDRGSPHGSYESSPNRRRHRERRRSRSCSRSATPTSDKESTRRAKDLRDKLSSRSSSRKSELDLDLRGKMHSKRPSSSRRDRSPRYERDTRSPSTRNQRSRTTDSVRSTADHPKIELLDKSKERSSDTKKVCSDSEDISKSKKSEVVQNEGKRSNEPTLVTVGDHTIIKRHVNQLFIRGDNIVMVAIVN